MLVGLRTVIYQVADVNAAKAWYSDILSSAPYFDEPFYVGFNVGGFELGLVPSGNAGLGGVSAYWGVADVAATVETLLAKGATVREGAHEVGGGIVVATVVDPFGNDLSVIFNPHFDLASVR